MEPEWWKPQDVARRWNISVSTVYRMHAENPVGFGRKMAGCVRIHRSQIEAIENLDLQRATAKVLRNHRRKTFRRDAEKVDHFA